MSLSRSWARPAAESAFAPHARRLAVLAFLTAAFVVHAVACDRQSPRVGPPKDGDVEPPKPNLVVRVAVEPDALHFAAPQTTKALAVHERLLGGMRRPAADATFTTLDPAVVSVDAAGAVTAVGYGDTFVRVESGQFVVDVPVRVRRDLLQTLGFADATNAVALWQHDSETLAGVDTGTELGGRDLFAGGVSALVAFGDYAYAIGSHPAPDHDTVYKVDPRDGSIVQSMPIVNATLGVSSQDASASALAFASPRKGYIAHRFRDGAGQHSVTVFDPHTMQITAKIVVPPATTDEPYFDGLYTMGHLLLLVDHAFDTVGFQFGTPRIYAVDMMTDTLYDLAPGDPSAGGTVALTGINPTLTVAPTGHVYAVCRGDGFHAVGMVIDVLDPLSFQIEQTLTFAPTVNGGPLAWDAGGRLYIGNNYGQTIVTVDGHTHTILRDAGTAIGFDGLGWVADMTITPTGRLIMGNPDFTAPGHMMRGFDTATDTNSNQPVFDEVGAADSPGHLAFLPRHAQPAFAALVLDARNVLTGSDAENALGEPTATLGGPPTSAAVFGEDGTLTVSFGDRWIVDGPGADFVVFGHATLENGAPGLLHAWRDMRPGRVEVSQDGVTWHAFPASENTAAAPQDPARYLGAWFGVTPTWRNADAPLHESVAGGDRFDLAQLGLTWARYVRLSGSNVSVDAVAALNHAMD